MSVVRSRPRAPSLLNSAARIGVLGLTVLFTGCASKPATTYPGDRLAGPMPPSPQQQAAWTPKVEIEDDGLPAQIAPRHRPPAADDPSEPWSPNYGSGGRSGDTPKPITAPARAASAEPQPAPRLTPAVPLPGRSPSLARLSELDEDAIVRQAIAEHEMRRHD